MTIIQAFLEAQYRKKTETEQKQLAKAREAGNAEKVRELEQKLRDTQAKFEQEYWLTKATESMAKQLSFGTHISKGVHPDAKGDNVAFVAEHELPVQLVGTHSLVDTVLDANGNAAALPLAAFFDFAAQEGATKIRDLILKDDDELIAALSSDPELAQYRHRVFKAALTNRITTPTTHERNKQTLWPVNPYSGEALSQSRYHMLVPLYPSALTHEVYQRMNALRYSDENKTARENRSKVTAEQRAYVSMPDIASTQLGGTKPQNVSQLTSRQGGRNYLLPSLPPQIRFEHDYQVSKFANSVFGKRLSYYARYDIQVIFDVIDSSRNTVEVRDKRKMAVDAVLHHLFALAEHMQGLPKGWSKPYQLAWEEKLWLDPKRGELVEEQEFAAAREQNDWRASIIKRFATWLNDLLKAEFPELKYEFADVEHLEWEREIEAMIQQKSRLGIGVFE